jgi:enoyl-CoA hydratase
MSATDTRPADEPLVLVDRPLDGVVRFTLNRPAKRNALSIALRDELSDHLEAVADDETARVVVITGAGDTFRAGFDLAEFDRVLDDPAFGERLWASSDRYHHRVATFPLPTVAAVNGPAIAGGFDLAVLCDVRVLATTARFAHPEYTFAQVVYGPLREIVGGAGAPSTPTRPDASASPPPWCRPASSGPPRSAWPR